MAPKNNQEPGILWKIWSVVPVLVVLFCVLYGSFVYFFHAMLPYTAVESKRTSTVVILVFFSIILFMWSISFIRAIFTKPGRVPPEWLSDVVPEPPDTGVMPNGIEQPDDAFVTIQYKTVEKKSMGGVRFCRKCKFSPAKPDRCHHCSICNTCVLKMDHHCPWLNNCVGFFNYKYFFLLIIYSSLLAWYTVATLLPIIIEALQAKNLKEFTSRELQIVAIFIMAAMLGCAVGALTSFHIYLTTSGYTTIELLEKKGKASRKGEKWDNPYDLGTMNNIKQVLGPNPALWLFPTRAGCEGQGVFFPTSSLRMPTGDEQDDPERSFLH